MLEAECGCPRLLTYPTTASSRAIPLRGPSGLLRRLAVQLLRQTDQFGIALLETFAALTLALLSPDAFASGAQLRYHPRLLILCKRACNLAHHDARGVTRICEVLAV